VADGYFTYVYLEIRQWAYLTLGRAYKNCR